MWNQTNFKTAQLWATDWPRMLPTFQATKRDLVQTPTVILKTRHNTLLQNQNGKEAEENESQFRLLFKIGRLGVTVVSNLYKNFPVSMFLSQYHYSDILGKLPPFFVQWSKIEFLANAYQNLARFFIPEWITCLLAYIFKCFTKNNRNLIYSLKLVITEYFGTL